MERNKSLNSGERQVSPTLDGIEYWHKWRYNEAVPFVKDKRVADLGCGIGYGSYILASKAKKVIGVDDSEDAIRYANTHYKKKNIEYRTSDVLEFNGRFDVVVAYEIVEHIEDLTKICDKLAKLCKKDGRIIISVPHVSIPVSISHYHHRHFTDKEIEYFFRKRSFICERLEMPNFERGLAIFYVGRKI